MAVAKTGSNKKVQQRVRRLDGKVVKIVLYNGRACGHGKYLAAEVDGKLVEDATGRPLPYRQVGTIEMA